jgi:hypothetical protein
MTLQPVSTEHNLELRSDVVDGQSQGLSQQLPSNKASHSTDKTAFDADVSIQSESPLTHGSQYYATDVLLHRDLVRYILQDYIKYVYPLIPVIHIPTFEINFNQEHDTQNQESLAVIISICALTVGLLPSRFWSYREYKCPLPFETRTEMANHCYKLNQSLRDIEYWDTVSHQKWVSSYLLALTFHHKCQLMAHA